MAVTRKSNSTAHPGKIVLDSQQTRYTTAQVQEAKARAKAAKDKEEVRCLAVPGRVVWLEDKIETEEQARRKHSMRPDLCRVRPTDHTSPR